jgi:adenine-specific DNA-methyltransferase
MSEIVSETLNFTGETKPDSETGYNTHHLYCMDNKIMLNHLISAGQKETYDLVYVDPPYNTGNTVKTGFTYHDSVARKEWLKWLRERFTLAKEVMKPEGIITVSIDDSEQAHMRILLDEIFGEHNFIANIIVDGGALKNNALFVSTTHEYLLVYSKNINSLKKTGVKWRTEREGVNLVLQKTEELKKAHPEDYETINKKFNEWLKAAPVSKRLKVFKHVDSKGVYTHSDLSSPNSKQHYTVSHPVTHKNVQNPSRGWGLTKEKLLQLTEAGEIEYFKDHTYQPLRKLYLTDDVNQVVKSVWDGFPARTSTHLLQKMLGERDTFNNPKNIDLMKHIINIMSPVDGKILDIFGGSGTTMHAVMELNREKKTTMIATLCTTNENNIFVDVTKPRIVAAATGEWADKKSHPKNFCFIKEHHVK